MLTIRYACALALAAAVAPAPLAWAQEGEMPAAAEPAQAAQPEAAEEAAAPTEGAATTQDAATQQNAAETLPQQEEGAAAAGAGEIDPAQLSYAIGYMTGVQMAQQGINVAQPQQFAQGVTAALSGEQPRLDPQQMQQVLAQWTEQRRQAYERQVEALQQQGQEQAAQGQEFLAQNQQKEGVQVTESGLQYQVLEEGEGEQPTAGDQVRVHYRGRLIDGTVFDSSYERGQPAEFPLGGVIPGWTEGLQLMKEGAKYRFYIPADLAYGAQGRPPVIPPNATLIFDVELLDVLDDAAGATGAQP